MTRVISLIAEKVRFAPIYRGQPDISWGLTPTIGRHPHDFSGLFVRSEPFTKETEKNFIHRLKRHTYLLYNRALDDWEALFLARHHGLPVRLLDWTTSPLVALYWACVSRENCDKDGAIWVFKNTTDKTHDYEDVFKNRDPFSIPGVRLVFPFYSSPRMIAQSSLFTIHDYPWADLSKLGPFGNEYNDVSEGQKWRILRDAKRNIIKELYSLQINARTLFPDLDGIAEEIVNTELVFRTGEQRQR